MIVPPRGRIPEICAGPSGSKTCSTIPRQPSRTPITSWPFAQDRRATARITAFRPGQSPPPGSTPIRIDLNIRSAPTDASAGPDNARVRLLLLGALSLLAAGPAGSGLRDAHACVGAPGFTCSTLDVPLDHSGRVAGTVHLAVGASDNEKAPRGVLLVITGGPGQPGVPSLTRIPHLVGAELRDYR